MATITVGTTTTTLDTGGSGFLRVANTGNRQATVVRGTDRTVLWPNCSTIITPNGIAVTATTPSGTTTLDTATGTLDAGMTGSGAVAGDDLSDDAIARLSGAFGPSRTTKRVAIPISADGASAAVNTFVDICQRSVIELPVATSRWRLRIRNCSPKDGTVQTGAITIANIYMGGIPINHDGSWAGNFSVKPTLAAAGGTTPADGSEWVSDWVTNPAIQPGAGIPFGLSWAFTCGAGTYLTKGLNSLAWTFYTAGAAAQVGQQTVPSGAAVSTVNFLDVRFEYEAETNLPVIFVVGDSLSAGQCEDLSIAPTVPGPSYTWPQQLGAKFGALVINGGVGTAQYDTTFGNVANWAYRRFDFTTTTPDAVILACGANEAANSVSTATFFTNVAAVRNILTNNWGIQRYAITTVIPQPRFKPGRIVTGAASGVASLSTSVPYANGDVVTIDYGIAATVETLTVSGASTGLGPYTTSFTGNTTKQHTAGATINLAGENFRTDYNRIMGYGAPAQVHSIIDHAALFATGDDLYPWFGTGTIHPGARTYRRMGAAGYARSLVSS